MKNLFKTKIKKIEINNNNELINIVMPSLPFSITSVWLTAGARFDPSNKNGLAHFFEHLLMTKTSLHPDRIELLQYMASLGINFNAYTSYEAACYYHFHLPEHSNESIKLLIDGLQKSIINVEDIEKEKNIILDEESKNRNNPQDYLWRLRQKALWPTGQLSNSLFGEPNSIKSINLEDIENFKKEKYDHAKKIWITIGNTDTDSIIAILEKKIKDKEKNIYLSKIETVVEPPTPLIIDYRNLDNVFIGVYYRTVSVKEDKNVLILNLLREYLANNWTSRLVEKLRINNDYTYWINGETENYSDTGYLGLVFSVNKKHLNKSLDIVEEEIEKIIKDGIKEDLLNQTKEAYLSRLSQYFITPENLLWWYGLPAISDRKIDDFPSYIKKIKAVTPKQIKDVAGKYLISKNRSVVLIGDVNKKKIIL